ncbi:P1 family peptidase [candidate division KSB1 bacterium]|nr:P1 family peptidase [candidate division KSB1 bacterium]
MIYIYIFLTLVRLLIVQALQTEADVRPRTHDLCVQMGIMSTGKSNAITNVAGVRVGHCAVIAGESIRTGVTAILTHGDNLFQRKMAATVYVCNGFGKLTVSTQVEELGEIELPIVLTNTISVPRATDALLELMLALPGHESMRPINVVVTETNDGFLNDIRGPHIDQEHVFAALEAAASRPMAEGAVGARTDTVAFGFKGGIGTSSRVVPESRGSYTVNVLGQTYFGGILTICGAPVGLELGQYYLREELEQPRPDANQDAGDGSIIIVISTDAPLHARNLKRLAGRTMMGLMHTGAIGSNGSGDYTITLSTTHPILHEQTMHIPTPLGNDGLSPLFLAAIETTEKAIYGSLFRTQTTIG